MTRTPVGVARIHHPPCCRFLYCSILNNFEEYEFFCSNPTFSDIDLARAIYMASRGSPKVILSIVGDVVHKFTACLALKHVLGAVAGSAQSADCAAQSSDTRKCADSADPANAPNALVV